MGPQPSAADPVVEPRRSPPSAPPHTRLTCILTVPSLWVPLSNAKLTGSNAWSIRPPPPLLEGPELSSRRKLSVPARVLSAEFPYFFNRYPVHPERFSALLPVLAGPRRDPDTRFPGPAGRFSENRPTAAPFFPWQEGCPLVRPCQPLRTRHGSMFFAKKSTTKTRFSSQILVNGFHFILSNPLFC